MDKIALKKLSLLTYLAKVDRNFHKSEKKVLGDFVREKGLNSSEFHLLQDRDELLADLDLIDEKCEILFLAMKVMQADNVIHESEVDFCKELARKLGYKPAVIDALASKKLSRQDFDKEVAAWKM